jgi:exodeoxyribonuclease VII large subunit
VSAPEKAAPPRLLRVGELVAGVRELLEDAVGRVWVVGEVSNLFRAGSGHVYFTLKDEDAQVRAVLFRGTARRLRFEPEEGLEVLVYGELSVYEPRGDLQLLVRTLEPRGAGALQVAFEQLRARLEAAGLFDPARKRPLPLRPRRVAVVTSPTGAALHDVLEVSGRRSPALPILIAPTRVQGEGAEQQIVAALERVAAWPEVDVILLVRGGGSLEDLWPFQSEALARALRACPLPVVCGVGHETDVTIADLAADARAPTPSAAAMLAFPDDAAARGRLDAVRRRLSGAMTTRLAVGRARLGQEWQALRAHAPRARLASQRARLEAGFRSLARALRGRLAAARARLATAAGRLDSLSPLAVLARGYALVRRADDGKVVRRTAQVAPGDALAIRLAEGELEAHVSGRGRKPEPGEKP